jgi:hypothetical protein
MRDLGYIFGLIAVGLFFTFGIFQCLAGLLGAIVGVFDSMVPCAGFLAIIVCVVIGVLVFCSKE